jgi:predicted metalloprotease
MRQLGLFLLLLLPASTLYARARVHEMEIDQARQVAVLVARHDNITVDDRTIVMNSMDTRRDEGFIPGYYSFSIVRESDTASRPDETIRMYVVSKKTADTWELNLCRHYEFPELKKFQQDILHKTGAASEDDPDMPKAIGCADQAQVKPTSE